MSEGSERAKAIFGEALDIPSSRERLAYLDQACGDDARLRAEVEELLQAIDQAGSFMARPVLEPQATLDFAPIAEKPGMMIDRYKLVHEIGHGGMGVVYMAVQKEPVKRKVALKIIKPGMDTKEVVARFNAERQALAMMDHQNIAHVLDGGSTESGRPYFVMELVDGTPIDEYCDECRYTTRQRLELFIQVCHAVQHAHLKGVIHRDIKPSNILVTNYDHLAVPKVIDFGVAKALHQQLTDQSVYTQVSQMVGTPMYMSPEQAQRTGLDVDTRTDVYSLGVLLYELLAGTTPFDKERLKNSSLDEIKRIIREEEPPKPSTRLSTLGESLDTVIQKRHTDSRTLTQELSGELDWIVMKAMEKDRSQRYESASDFAQDVQRYLDDEPVHACPPSTAYRLKKFARRNKAALAFAGTVALTIFVGTGIATSQAVRATKAESIAEQRLSQVDEQRKQAQRNYERARRAVKQMLTRVADEEVGVIPEMKEVRRRLLEDAVAFYSELLRLSPGDAVAHCERGDVYQMLANHKEALADYEKSVELDAENARFHASLAALLVRCADVAFRVPERGAAHAAKAIELEPGNNRYRLLLADAYVRQGDFAPARAELERAAKHLMSAEEYEAIAMSYDLMGDNETALPFAQRAVAMDPVNAWCRYRLAVVLDLLGEHEKALEEVNKAIELNRKPNAPRTLYFYELRGGVYLRLKMYTMALADLNRAAELGPFRSVTYKRRAATLFRLGNFDKAMADLNKAIELLPEDLSTLRWIPLADVAKCTDEPFRTGLLKLADKAVELTDQSARAYAMRGQIRAAFGLEAQAVADLKAACANLPKEKGGELGSDRTWRELYLLLYALPDRDEVIDGYRKTIEIEPDNPWLCNGLAWRLATCKTPELRAPDEAVTYAEKAITLKPNDGNYWNTLGVAQYGSGASESALESLKKSMELRSGGDACDWFFLAMAHWQLEHKAEANQWFQKAAEWMAQNDPDDEELLQFRKEAAELLGISETAATPKPQPKAATGEESESEIPESPPAESTDNQEQPKAAPVGQEE